MIEIVEYKTSTYPLFQTTGNSAQFAVPYAKHVCKGKGYDIGCNRLEWALPGSIPIDPAIDPVFNANKLPIETTGLVDYIFSSHCLEHVSGDWYNTLQYWYNNLKPNGTLFLYLPDYSQEYWRPWNNRKHIHAFTPEILNDAFIALGMKNIFVSGIDLNNSFMIMGEKFESTNSN